MAVGWVTALKLVPWGDVLEATPQILQAAKKLLGSTRQGTADAAAGTLAGAGDAATPPVALELQQLRERVARLEQEQQESAVLIQSLAEQNAQVVQAVEVLRLRIQRLAAAIAVLGAVCVGLIVWALRQ
jgi:chromosome segregation ATPase